MSASESYTLSRQGRRYRLSRWTRVSLLGCVILTTGCVSTASLQDWNYTRTNKSRAARAWKAAYSPSQRTIHGCDFEAGFKAGFVAAATANCQVPAVPPPKYWSAKYQCSEGQVFIQNWFRGYQCGLASADSQGYSQFNQVPVSPVAPTLNFTGCGECYAPDRCNCSSPGELPLHGVSQIETHSTHQTSVEPEPSLEASALQQGVRTAGTALIGPSDVGIVQVDYQRVPLN
jgi:hypothetical protein